ncbi:sporulation phosphorelay system protein KapB [Paenibacillus koleovorans]|uniref:sporulation phosphorelay system protein KapB n=1 Tax=Paenibacillus koleovorans TaxID=121608 RepID=UPI000FD9DD57|nr:sporulation phosphorelay system protein KapB [Paenibacillus koleovorans]
MAEMTLFPGAHVLVEYKTGQYIGQLLEWSPPRALVQIAAVVKHPDQGDLHRPLETEVALFHQRRALSHREKTWIPVQSVHPYRGTVPEYTDSLRQALEAEQRHLEKTRRWAERSLEELAQLQKDYFPHSHS